MSEIMKTDLAERIDNFRFCLSQIPQTLTEELSDTLTTEDTNSATPSRKSSTPLTIFQTLSKKSLEDGNSATPLRNFRISQTLSDHLPIIMEL